MRAPGGGGAAPAGKAFAAMVGAKLRRGSGLLGRGEARAAGAGVEAKADGVKEAVHRRGESESESGSGSESGSAGGGRDEIDVLDPSARHVAQMGPPVAVAAFEVNGQGSEAAVRGRSLEELLPALVRRIAWAGDRHKGTVRLELGAGAYAGTIVTVHADGGRVRVELAGTEGPELDRLRVRLDARLRGHGLDVESVT